ncbi:hypothetical protein FUA23_18560 [Neolewinella aurantiaca]|uniref:Uncharacterized protein n=1 Tax=Neolewinella aurantiaca TaxID=2602767 RepID=A0A5C7FP16_9BACT|nr:hypothetical protein [Neolewinella aurantiaca]TXF87096.1 hypothetical protein FUA23_18560 [Neolewinella aurantiaca]
MFGDDDDDGSGGGSMNECPDGFVRIADDCVCESDFQFGAEDCITSIDSGFMYSPLVGCPGGMAIKLTNDFKHRVELSGESYERFGMFFIQPRRNISGNEITPISYLSKSLEAGKDSIIFELSIDNYFSYDTLAFLPSFIFHGVREDSTSLRGTMSWGERLDYWKFGEIYGSCDAVFQLPE